MINMRELTKKIAVAFGLLVFTAGFNIMDAQAGAALNFESGSPIDAVVLPQAISNNHLVGGTKITIEAWIRPTTLAGNGIIVSNYTTPNNQLQFLLRRDGSTILFLLGPGNVIASYSGISTAANTVTNTIWQHVAGVYDGTVASVYINGVLSASNTTSIDVAAIVEQLMKVENKPLDAIASKISQQKLVISDLGTIQSKVATFQDALKDFENPI
jgi:hypothetical protein